jgi:type IX secretion system PorP/SprF family membrane protein
VGSNGFILSFGLQAGISDRSIDLSKLIFGDQIDMTTGYIPGSTSLAEVSAPNNKFYFDSGAGLNLVIGQFDLGTSLQHINKPNESFTETPAKLPMRNTTHMSYRWELNQYNYSDDDAKSYLIPSVVFYQQSTSQSYSVGFQYKRGNINAGLWYRSGGVSGPSAVVLSLIFDIFTNKESVEKIRAGFSHDVPVSGLNYSNTSGTTEGSLNYQTTFPSSAGTYHKFEGETRCYDFY